jgi:hypothetical protein
MTLKGRMAPQPGLDHFARKMGRVFCANLGLALVRAHAVEKIEILGGIEE